MPLNEQLYDDFFVQELEKRLETDILTVGGLLDLFGPVDGIDGAACFCAVQCSSEQNVCSPVS